MSTLVQWIPSLSPTWQGALWKALACLCFALINGCVKFLLKRLSYAEIAFFEHLFASFWLMPFLFRDVRRHLTSQKPRIHLLRVAISISGVLLWYKALDHLPMAHAVGLGFLGPILTSLGAVLFLKEPMTPARLGAVAFGLIGGMFISRSFAHLYDVQYSWYLLLPIGSATAFSCSTLFNKYLTSLDKPLIIVASLCVLMTPFFGLLASYAWTAPSLEDLIWLSLLGGLTALAHWSVTQSFVCSDLLFLLPIGTLRFIFTALIGVFIFQQCFDLSILLGFCSTMAALTILGCFEKKNAREKR